LIEVGQASVYACCLEIDLHIGGRRDLFRLFLALGQNAYETIAD